jgi:hypothetical protein
MNELLRNITTENYIELLNSFERSKEIFWDDKNNKLIHPGEFGEYREDILKRFLTLYIPENYGISSGFIIASNGDISHQCDIIIYDKRKTPKIQNLANQRFFPIETILGVGEIKSTINSIGLLNDYLIKLSELKKLRSAVKDPTPYKRGGFKTPFNPKDNFADNIFTFLLCYKFAFDFEIEKIDYQEVDFRLWHNMVLSLKDGLLTYKTNGTKNLYFSFAGKYKHEFWFLKNDGQELPVPIEIFLSGLSFFENNNTLLEIHIERYLKDDLMDNIE